MAPVGPAQTPRVMSASSMVERYLRSRGIRDERLLAAMAKVPRHLFVPEAFRERAYSDHPLPIGYDQTITQPYVVALMTQELKLQGREKVLEIGTGSGYQTAILAELAKSVFSLDRVHAFVKESRRRLEGLGYHNISIRAADGAGGWSEFAPYDRILITAAVKAIPETVFEQLDDGGVLVFPSASTPKKQEIFVLRKTGERLERRSVGPCNFIPWVE